MQVPVNFLGAATEGPIPQQSQDRAPSAGLCCCVSGLLSFGRFLFAPRQVALPVQGPIGYPGRESPDPV